MQRKKIDLKHGWLLFVCIVTMCTIGSVAAYYTHQTVLGGFSLFLCVAIGIRFLVKPDSKDRETSSETVKLSMKEIAVSLFFGLTIGFGTGFFGSGGGMMMLIVFTAMLGYDRKTAVGTSAFIMTFTAFIASVSHILMEPTIILECWDYLLISIVTATFFSVISARFANKVNAKAVGLTTGVILLVLGLTMIFINNIEKINMVYFIEFWKLLGIYTGYIAGLAIFLLIIRYTTKVPDYIFRKLLHFVAFTSILPLVFGTQLPWIAVLVELFWGIAGAEYKYIAVASIMAWGPGDAVAAVVGKKYGRHKLQGKMIEGVKSVEGSVGMCITSFVCTLAVLLTMSELNPQISVILALVIAPIAALTELFTKKGFDTVTVPVVSCIILCLLNIAFL